MRPLALVVLAAVAFWPFLAEGRIIVSLDAYAYFYPNYAYAASRLRDGALPLWNPDLFAGVPFLANSQVGVLYPPNLLFLAFPAAHAFVYSAALHTLIAGLAMYAFARRGLDLSPTASFVAGATFMLSGYVGSTVGHLNQLQAIAWVPLFVLACDRLALGRHTWLPIAAVTIALVALAGHSQVLYLGLIIAAIWSLVRLARNMWGASKARLGRFARLAVSLGLAVLVGIGLAAAQLLPTLELARYSVRAGGLTFDDAAAASLPPWMLLQSLLPSFRAGVESTEWVAYVGFIALALAAIGLSSRRRQHAAVFAGLAVLGLALSLGRFSPVFSLAYHWVPGFDLFRVPARWLLMTTFALAALAGLGFDELSAFRRTAEDDPRPSEHADAKEGAPPIPPVGRLPGLSIVRTFAPAFAAVGVIAALLVWFQRRVPDHPISFGEPSLLPIWTALAAVALLAVGLGRFTPLPHLCPLLVVGLCFELLMAGRLLALYPPNLFDVAEKARPPITVLQAEPGLHRVLALSQQHFDPGDLAMLRASTAGVLTPERFMDYLVAIKYRDTLVPNLPMTLGLSSLDGYDGGVLPLERFIQVKELFPLDETNLVDGRINIQVTNLPPPSLLGWLNVRFVLVDRARDTWSDGVYYDRAVTARLAPGEAIALDDLPRQRTTGLSIITGTEAAPPGARLLEVVLQTGDGQTERWELLAGDQPGSVAGAHRLDDDPVSWLSRLALSNDAFPVAIELRNIGSTPVTVGSLSLIGSAGAPSRSVPPDPRVQLRYLGDVKIYEILSWQQRLYVVHGLRLAADDAAALQELASATFDPTSEVVVTPPELDRLAASSRPAGALAAGEAAEIVSYEPGDVRARVTLRQPGVLVFGESWYPGWEAEVDGVPAPIARVNLLYQGVWLDAGTHEVRFQFRPRSFSTGLIVSGVSAVALVGWSVLSYVHRPRERGTPTDAHRPKS